MEERMYHSPVLSRLAIAEGLNVFLILLSRAKSAFICKLNSPPLDNRPPSPIFKIYPETASPFLSILQTLHNRKRLPLARSKAIDSYSPFGTKPLLTITFPDADACSTGKL